MPASLYKLLTLTLLTLLLTACQSTQIKRESEIVIPTTFSETEAATGSAEISRWWRQWQDPQLSRLIEQGLDNGYDIRIAASRLAEALAISRLAQADLGPQAGIGASTGIAHSSVDVSTNKNINALLGPAATMVDKQHDINAAHINMSFSAAWEPDIFGQKQSDADAAYYAALGMQEKVYGAQMLLASQIADHYLQARATEQKQMLAADNIATLKRLAKYVQGRFQAGDATMHEVNNVQSKLNAALAKQSTIQAEYDANARSIAVLTGQLPQDFELAKTKVDILAHQPDAPSGQTPQGLLERRPDLRAYAALVNAYAAKLASAKADLLPRFSISFLGQSGHIELDSHSPDLRGWGSLVNVGIQVPLFTNGRIKANIESADSRLQTALLQYDQSLLRALSEVDNAYQAYHALQQQHDLLNKASKQAQKRAIDADKLFTYGHQRLDEALTAQLEATAMQENLIQSQLAQAQMLLNLYKALGGGWAEK